jgi:hypothetical protein
MIKNHKDRLVRGETTARESFSNAAILFRVQLKLEYPLFKRSKVLPAFLTYIVKETISGGPDF